MNFSDSSLVGTRGALTHTHTHTHDSPFRMTLFPREAHDRSRFWGKGCDEAELSEVLLTESGEGSLSLSKLTDSQNQKLLSSSRSHISALTCAMENGKHRGNKHARLSLDSVKLVSES